MEVCSMAIKLSSPQALPRVVMTVVGVVIAPFFAMIIIATRQWCEQVGRAARSFSFRQSSSVCLTSWQVCVGVVDDCQQVDDHVCACDLCARMLMWIYVYTPVCTSQLMYSILDHTPFLLLVTYTWSWPWSVARRDRVLQWALIDAE